MHKQGIAADCVRLGKELSTDDSDSLSSLDKQGREDKHPFPLSV